MRLRLATVLTITCALVGAASANPLDHFASLDRDGIDKVPHAGESHVLVIPSRVGVTEFPAATLADLQKIFDPAGGPGTYRTYWQTVSNGRYDPIPTLVMPVLYPTSCPIPNHTVDDCHLSVADIGVIASGGVGMTLADMLVRVRDEQNIDLAQFDVNTFAGPGQDGYFDGLIIDTDIISGLGFPLAALNNDPHVNVHPGGTGDLIGAGVTALIPPEFHEFGHNLGFIDLYNGPPVNCLMADLQSTLGAFSRQQIGWGKVNHVNGNATFKLQPVLDGGDLVRIGDGKQYLMIENRGGVHHADLESWPAGIEIYTVDETKLPDTRLGFLDLNNKNLYYPNMDAPYLFVNWPIHCDEMPANAENSCVLSQSGLSRELTLQDGTSNGFTLTIGQTYADGSIDITLTDNNAASTMMKKASGCTVGGAPVDVTLCGLLLVALVSTRSARRRNSLR